MIQVYTNAKLAHWALSQPATPRVKPHAWVAPHAGAEPTKLLRALL